MKNKLTETKLRSGIGLTRHLIGGVLCLAAISLICSSASAQNLFAVDPANGNIDEFTPNGVRSTFASGSIYPVGLAFDEAGNLFVGWANAGSGAVYKFTPAGVRTTFASGLNYPSGLAFDKAGNLFADAGSGAVYKFTPTGARTTFASGLFDPGALAFDSAGNLFVVDRGFDYDFVSYAAVYKFTPSGVRSTVVSENNQHHYPVPQALAIDGADNLFVGWANAGSGAVYKFTPAGVRTTFASGVSGPLAFQPPQIPTPTLINISTRGSVETGDNVLIGGFIVTGTDLKQVVLRGLGPTLTGAGVTGALADPTLQLFDGSGHPMWFNDNWKDSQQAAIQATGLASPNDLESAILFNLQPGNYTAILAGKNGNTGVGLMEVYDISPGPGVFAELTNVSTRGFVGSGQDVMIGGFISSGGNGSLQVIIRALGPTLSQFGVSNALIDPTLALVNSNGQVLASNDNWKNTQQAQIQATGFAPPNDLESAIYATLPNGNYTAIVSGKNGATGVGLLEVYKVAVATNK